MADVEREPGSLPLLSTALLDLWQRRDGRRLRHARYEQTGGVRGAVARLAEDAFEQLSPDGQTVARDVLLRLVQEGEGGVVERRRVALAELETGSGEAAAVISQLTAHRILTADAETVELTHEALLREWPRLRAWIEEEREALGTQRRLAFAASEWERLGNDEDALYRGTRLAEAEAWRSGHGASLADVERGFLDASGRRRDRERAAHRRRVWLGFTALGVAVLALSAVALVAVDESRQALRERNIAVSGRLAAAALDSVDDDPGRAVELARRAVRTAPIAPADAVLRQAVLSARELAVLRPSGGSVLGADVTSDGRRAVTASDDGRLRLWDLRTRRLVATYAAHRGKAFMPRFGGDDRWIASAGEDGALAVTGTASGRTRVLARDPRTMATSVAVSPDGAAVAAGYADGTVRTAAVTGGGPARVLGGQRGLVARIAFSGDGRHLAAASWDGTAQLWDLGGNGPPVVLRRDPEGVGAVGFADRDRLVVVGDAHGRLRFSDTATGRPAGTVRVNDLAIDATPVSPDGALIAGVGEDGAIRVFDATARQQTTVLSGHRDRLNDADFAARGHVLITTGADGTVRTWDVGGTTVLPGSADALSLSHDGQRLAVTGQGRRVRVWDPRTGTPAASIAAGGEPASVRLSRDGTRIAVALLDGDVAVWDVGTGERLGTFRDNGEQAYAVGFDGTGRRLVTGGTNGRVVIRDLAGGRPIVLTGHRRAVDDVSFDPDGGRVLSAGSDGTVRIWDVAQERPAARVLTGSPRRSQHRGVQRRRAVGRERGPGRHDPRLAAGRRTRHGAARTRRPRHVGGVQPSWRPAREHRSGRHAAYLGPTPAHGPRHPAAALEPVERRGMGPRRRLRHERRRGRRMDHPLRGLRIARRCAAAGGRARSPMTGVRPPRRAGGQAVSVGGTAATGPRRPGTRGRRSTSSCTCSAGYSSRRSHPRRPGRRPRCRSGPPASAEDRRRRPAPSARRRRAPQGGA